MMRIATCQYHFTLDEHLHYPKKIEDTVATAKLQGADLLLLPEYLGIMCGSPQSINDKELFASMQDNIPQYLALFRELAERHEIYIQAGTTIIAADDDHQYANRAYLFSPKGKFGFQDKLQLTAYEKQSALLIKANSQTIFDTAFGKIGIAICYDSEFTEIVRGMVKAGAKLILVPSYTTTTAGYYRVSISCRARAIENQCYVAMSSMHGTITMGVDGTEMTVGAAGIYGPAEMDVVEDGVLAQGKMNTHDLIYADLDMSLIDHIRSHGDVHNYTDSLHYQHSSTLLQELSLV